MPKSQERISYSEETATGKESSNSLMADSLPKTIIPTKLVKSQDFNLRHKGGSGKMDLRGVGVGRVDFRASNSRLCICCFSASEIRVAEACKSASSSRTLPSSLYLYFDSNGSDRLSSLVLDVWKAYGDPTLSSGIDIKSESLKSDSLLDTDVNRVIFDFLDDVFDLNVSESLYLNPFSESQLLQSKPFHGSETLSPECEQQKVFEIYIQDQLQGQRFHARLIKIQVAQNKVKIAFENADSSLRVESIPLKIKAGPGRIKKINYKINKVTKNATMRLKRNNQPQSLTAMERSLKAKIEWINTQDGKLGLPPPSELIAFRLTLVKKKRKRTSKMIKEIFVSEDIRMDGMERNLIHPQGVIGSPGLAITEPEVGIFYYNGNFNLVFQRENEFHLATTALLLRQLKHIKRDTPEGEDMVKKL
nr:hypothetical protein [Tanacetum cinerariifolium]